MSVARLVVLGTECLRRAPRRLRIGTAVAMAGSRISTSLSLSVFVLFCRVWGGMGEDFPVGVRCEFVTLCVGRVV